MLITQNFKYICGYNIIQFDLPICSYNASKYFDITSVLNPLFNVSQKKIWDMRNVIDLMDVVRGTHFSNISLDEALYHYDIPSSKDDISGSQVSEVYYSEGPERIYEYVKKDVFATVNLFLKLTNLSCSSNDGIYISILTILLSPKSRFAIP